MDKKLVRQGNWLSAVDSLEYKIAKAKDTL